MADGIVLVPSVAPPGQPIDNTYLTVGGVPVFRQRVEVYPPQAGGFPIETEFADTAQLDAFNRLRVASPQTLFYSTQEYTSDNLFVENYTAGTATVTYTQATSSTTLSTAATTANNRALRQTKVYWRYQPGKSHVIKMTGVLALSGTPAGAAVARLGYFDDNNGLFFGRDTGGYFVCTRTSTSGSVVETKVYQTNWNLDTMNGLGPSGITADFTKAQIFMIDLQWLGVGGIRFGLFLNGSLRYVHEFENANSLAQVYMQSANLPARYEVFNDGGVGSVISMMCICIAIESEGGVVNEGGRTFTASNSNAVKTIANTATRTPILSIRPVDTFQGKTFRGHIESFTYSLLAITNPIYWELVWNAATLTTPAWTAVDATNSGAEYDISSTAYTGGIVIDSGIIAAGGSGSGSYVTVGSSSDASDLILARTYANVRDTLTLVARGLGGSATAYATLNWMEQR